MDDLRPHAQVLEETFFFAGNSRLAESLHELKVLEETSGLLSEVSGITDAGILRRLSEIGMTPTAVTGLTMVPLVVLAWADGKAEEAERRAIVAALENTLFFHTINRDIVEAWLMHPPPEALVEAWEAFACRLVSRLNEAETASLRTIIVERARAVALAAGRVLGMGGEAPAERALLHRIEGAFSSCH